MEGIEHSQKVEELGEDNKLDCDTCKEKTLVSRQY
jgi:hypothetical protein